MNNYWAIAIGINQYQYFQPLNYAQRDAQEFQDFLVEEAGFAADHCFLLTDGAQAMISGAPVPSRANILDCLTTVCEQKLQPADFLWIFFSGYGVRFQGRDYLVPIEGHSEKLSFTAIAAEDLMKMLRSVPTEKILLVLDINRSQGVLDGQGAGEQFIALAQQHNISLLLSCQPDQFSQETLALRHGFFTAALLEGLRYEHCLTPDALSQFLGQRMAELTDHHWRPPQSPVAVLAPNQRYQLILPKETVVLVGAEAGGEAAAETRVPGDFPSRSLVPYADLASQSSRNGFDRETNDRPVAGNLDATAPQSKGLSAALGDPFWRNLILWASAIALTLLVGVFLRNREALLGDPQSSTTPTTNQTDPTQPTLNPNTPQPSQAILKQAIDSLNQPAPSVSPAIAFANAIQLANQIPASDPLYDQAQGYVQSWSNGVLDLARAQALQGDYPGAIATAQRLLPTQQPEIEAEVQQLIREWQPATSNQDLLDQAKSLIRPDQASSYNKAIDLLRRIPADQPLANDAQILIDQWSQSILDLAKMRAASGDLELAVRTAELVPPDSAAHQAAETAIAEWQQQIQQEVTVPVES